ncbi:dihydrodipicolinate reductase [Neokomagataea thailandica NBRC 106555]|uniref:4-hydroxy-tetrahydrodipicolinate reductase n=2 Tax=Neokomagataea TaxID=1223423 RepID=A0A4Y6V7I0_9PROT|nr:MULTISPECIES: 4-hydroxy-tetrahydrodipicolinate reductase [Neokomagataea]QDH24640.1 4-hydroxy-tetrahydrodipicolinate reductase [Neokomagataea tanensis]GBR53977.1 dihydrodipicolinate reductase [Neokomagataea thailandica NBRC 106555]
MTDLRIGIAGITGRLGSLCAEEAGTALSGGTSRHPVPEKNITSSPDELAKRSDVIIDVSNAATIAEHAKCFSQNNCAWVIGTTGLDNAAQDAIKEASTRIPVLQAANFSPALTVFLDLARQISAALPSYDAEIVETHHRQKLDAPSGTALAIGEAVAQGRGLSLKDVARTDQNGRRPDNAIGFASLRGGQVIGAHDLLLLAADEEITLSHRALDRRVFARGALHAARWLATKKPGLYSMADTLKNE